MNKRLQEEVAKGLAAPQLRKPGLIECALVALTVAFVAAFHSAAMEDRLLLILYAIGVVGSVYTLVRRRAFVLAVMVVTGAGSAFLANVYFDSAADSWHPMLDPLRDIAALGILLFLIVKLIFEAYRVQKEDREREVRRAFEEKMVAMRAAALRSTSHEVRTPLGTIIAINETLLNGTAGSLTAIQKDFLKDIDDAAKHLMSLVNDILDYAKAEAGMIQLAPEPVALVELVDQCVTMVEPRAEKAGIHVTAHVASDVNEVVADPLRLKQILLNLLSNAIKYNERDGLVNVRVRGDGNHVLISVRDTGRGIAADQLEHIFNPYFQAAREDQSIGTGLGLAIIKHLTELHGGTISVESVPQTGSVFAVRLPRQIKTDKELVAAPLAAHEFQALTSEHETAGEVVSGNIP
jgi:signal transduction histidine kinase